MAPCTTWRDVMPGGLTLAWAIVLTLLGQAAAAEGVGRQTRVPHLNFDCQGRGEPTVILDAGLGGSALEWIFVFEQLRSETRVCRFDRAGYGNSGMGRLPRTSSRIANELFVTLTDSAESPPYILVGHSFGGYNMQVFARRYPYLAAGLVLVDASHPDQVERFLEPPLNLLTAPSSRFGIVRFREPPPPHPALPEPVRRTIADRARRWKTKRTIGSELLGFRDSADDVRQSPPLGTMPLLVISRGHTEKDAGQRRHLMERLWLELQTELADLSEASAHLVAIEAGHNVHIEQPEVVAFGISLLVERARHTGITPIPRTNGLRAPLRGASWLRDNLDLHPESHMRQRADAGGHVVVESVPGGGAP